MENRIIELKERIDKIEKRNRQVEGDKAWETSNTRILFICTITYIIAVVFMACMNTKNVFWGALVPVIGFYLSTQSLSRIKTIWLKKNSRLKI